MSLQDMCWCLLRGFLCIPENESTAGMALDDPLPIGTEDKGGKTFHRHLNNHPGGAGLSIPDPETNHLLDLVLVGQPAPIAAEPDPRDQTASALQILLTLLPGPFPRQNFLLDLLDLRPARSLVRSFLQKRLRGQTLPALQLHLRQSCGAPP